MQLKWLWDGHALKGKLQNITAGYNFINNKYEVPILWKSLQIITKQRLKLFHIGFTRNGKLLRMCK